MRVGGGGGGIDISIAYVPSFLVESRRVLPVISQPTPHGIFDQSESVHCSATGLGQYKNVNKEDRSFIRCRKPVACAELKNV
jgi:hypothetical protein